MDIEKSVKTIKEKIQKYGGLITTQRQVGKSTALAEFLLEHPLHFYVVCPTHEILEFV